MGQSPFRLSIVVPMYNEEDVLDTFFSRVIPIVASLTNDYEVICIDDGSNDRTFDILSEYRSDKYPNTKILSLSRNFGKEAALMAGLDHATGDAIIPIDADLQDPPELIIELVDKWQQGYDMVLAARRTRNTDTFAKRLTAQGFYQIAGKLSATPIPPNVGDFRLMDKKVVQALKLLPERTRFTKGILGWLGFNQATIYYDRQERAQGTTKWRYWGLWNYALEGIFSFSTLPLRIWSYMGLFVSVVSALYMAFIIIRTMIIGIDVPGYASLLVVVLFFSGLNMVGLGILGEYLGRVFIEVKQRPLYLIRRQMGFNDE